MKIEIIKKKIINGIRKTLVIRWKKRKSLKELLTRNIISGMKTELQRRKEQHIHFRRTIRWKGESLGKSKRNRKKR